MFEHQWVAISAILSPVNSFTLYTRSFTFRFGCSLLWLRHPFKLKASDARLDYNLILNLYALM